MLPFILALPIGTTPTAEPSPTFCNGDMWECAALTIRAGFAFEYSSAVSDFHWVVPVSLFRGELMSKDKYGPKVDDRQNTSGEKIG